VSIQAVVENDLVRLPSGVHLPDGTEEVARPVWSGCRLDDHRFAIWSDVLTVWDLRNLGHPIRLEGHARSITGAIPLKDDQFLTWAGDETLRRWDLAQVRSTGDFRPPVAGQPYPLMECTPTDGHAEWVRGALALSTGEVASWAYDHSLRLWQPDIGLTRCILSGHCYWVMGAVELPDLRLASWSDDCDVLIWDLTSGGRITVMQGSRRPGVDRAWPEALTHDDFVNGVAVVNSQTLVSWADDSTLRIWDLQTFQERFLIELGSTPDSVAGLGEETVCARWDEDSMVGIWSVNSGQKIGLMAITDFVHTYPKHIWSITNFDSEAPRVLRGSDFEVSVTDGALKVKHQVWGELYWHGDRTMTLYCMTPSNVICASVTEKDLAFIHIEAPNAR
jgi:WD40 repeat protein